MTTDSEISLDELRELRISPLCQDEKWKEAMAPYLTEDVYELLAIQEQYVQDEKMNIRYIIELQKQKREILAELFQLTDALQEDSREAESTAEKLKGTVEKINEEMENLQYQGELLPGEIRRLNGEILKRTVEIGYPVMVEKQANLLALLEEGNALRERLRELGDLKFEEEEALEHLSQFMHALLGKKLSDRMDHTYGLHENEKDEH